MSDPDLELTGSGGVDLLALVAFLPSVIPSFFTQNRSATGILGFKLVTNKVQSSCLNNDL